MLLVRGIASGAGLLMMALVFATPASAQDEEAFTATVTPWVRYDSEGRGHVVERGEFAGDAVVENHPNFVLFRMCDAEGEWNGTIRMTQLPDGVGSLQARTYPMNHRPREYTTSAFDVPSGSRVTSGSITLESVASDVVVGSVQVRYQGSRNLRLASGEPPAEYALEMSFRAPVVEALTPDVAPECYPASP
jgi:hypothetical protein